MKKCSGCQKQLDESNFYKGYRNCKICHQKIVSKYQDNNKEKVALGNRKRKLFNRYGLTVDGYEILFKKQEGKCAICKSTKTKNKNSENLFVDHCHTTKRVRGLICHKCNILLGKLKDDVDWLLSAVKHLSE